METGIESGSKTGLKGTEGDWRGLERPGRDWKGLEGPGVDWRLTGVGLGLEGDLRGTGGDEGTEVEPKRCQKGV